jgi:hypothetical protein
MGVGNCQAILVASTERSVSAMARMMGPQPATVSQLASAAVGTSFEVALLVTAIGDGRFTGTVLERDGDGVYHRADGSLPVRWPADTPVVMGKADEIVVGAAVQAHGQVAADRALDADRLAILTGYLELR